MRTRERGEIGLDTKHLLGIDIGTSSVKVAVVDEQGNLLGSASEVYRLIQDGPGYQQDRKSVV